jgi:hypothetical protein
MELTNEEFLQEVKNEINLLKKNATKEELGRLDFRSFSPVVVHLCLYGQMTGDCYSVRAFVLKETCSYVNGSPFTDLENYIKLPQAQNEKIISFLRSETDTLEI